jgi:peptide/nickel transport system substrate-binding protein
MGTPGIFRRWLFGRRVGRRTLLRAGLLSGLAVAFGGCAPQASPQPSGTALESPRPGGVLTVYVEGDPPNFDLHQNSSYVVLHPLAPCYNLLVQFDPLDHTRIIPDLAEHWEVSPDGKVYTFYLKRGVKFHHGKPFKAEDVKASFERIIWPPQGMVSPRRETFSAVDAVDAVDDYTVRFVLKRPNPSLPANIAQGLNVIYPKDLLDARGDMKKEVVGTGPFRLKEYLRGVSIELVKNPDYHVPGRPYLDGIKFFIIPDPNTAISAFITGQILLFRPYFDPPVDDIRRQVGDRAAVESVPGSLFHSVDLNVRRRPWDDPRVRLAVSLAVDRSEAVKVITKGYGFLSGIMQPGGPWAMPPAELAGVPGFGPDKDRERAEAKRLLAEAGYPDGFETRLLVRKGASWEPAAIFVKDQLSRVGINVTLDVQEYGVYQDRVFRREFDAAITQFANALDDPDYIFGQAYLCNSGRNYSGACEPEIDALFERQSQTADPERRRQLVWELERRAHTAAYRVLLARVAEWALYWKSVRNFKLQSSRYLTERLEHIWLAE